MADPQIAAIPVSPVARGLRVIVAPDVELSDAAGQELVDELVARARNRDADAWEALYRLAYPSLFSYAARRVGTHLADDVVSETMARAVASIQRFEQGRSFVAWLFGIGRHVISDFGRRGRRWARQPVEVPVRTEPNPGEALELDVDHRRINAAFSRLSPSDRELLELRVLAGLSSEEVGALIGKKAEAVRTAQSRALAKLRAMMTESDE